MIRHKYALWLIDINPINTPYNKIIELYHKCAAIKNDDALTYHNLADAYLQAIEKPNTNQQIKQNEREYLKDALESLVYSIINQNSSSVQLQDLLRFLTLWFNYGVQSVINMKVDALITQIPTKLWIQVIPQLVARLDHKNQNIYLLLEKILFNIANYRPSTIIYPLRVFNHSFSDRKILLSNELLQFIASKKNISQDHLELLCSNLENIAVSLLEYWVSQLNIIRENFLKDDSYDDMLAQMTELFSLSTIHANTLQEKAFLIENKDKLEDARRLVLSSDDESMTMGWNIFNDVSTR